MPGRDDGLRDERERVLDRPISLEDEQRSAVRQEIISSWRRCQVVGVAAHSEDVPYRPEFERPNRLLRAAGPVIDRLADQMEGGPVSILLADSDAQIIDRRAGSRELARALDRASVCPGFLYAEEFAGTNGIGSALEECKPFTVSGPEHFRENLQEFTCIGSPVRHPITGSVEGVLDVTCRVDDTHELLKPVVLAAVREIESRIYADASRREQMLLEHFLRASRRATTAVLSLNETVVMANTAASVLLDVSDQAMLWEWACRTLGTGDECVSEVRLARDVVVQARATRVGERGAMAGVLVEMRPQSRPTDRTAATRPRARPPRLRAGRETLAGRSVASVRLREDIDAALRTDVPLLVCGEPGAGKLHVASHLHRRRSGDEPMTVLDALASHDEPAEWIARLIAAVGRRGTILLRHIDQLVPELAARVEGVVDAASESGTRVLATARGRGEHTATARVLDHFPLSLTVPPLRFRTEDIPDLAPMLLAAHTSHRPVPRLLPGTVATLAALDWPGNVRELEAVLATAVTRSLGSDLALGHLPPEYRSTSSRTGRSSLRRAERDIVMEALAETHGNKLAAAERLGIARSTLYRKIRDLGIDENRLPAATAPR